MIRVGLLGSSGRMGRWVCQLLKSEFSDVAELTAQVERDESHDSLLKTDVVIDFSSPDAMKKVIQSTLQQKCDLPVFVVGSTGWSTEGKKEIAKLGEKTSVLVSSNFSVGIGVLSEILKVHAPILKKLGYTPVITDVHHHHKKDSPSGTSLTLQKAINPTHPEQTQTHSIRAGEVIGEHRVTFYGPGDQVSFSHVAQDRSIFARGAIQAALWLTEHSHPTQKRILESSHPLTAETTHAGVIEMADYFKFLLEDPKNV